MKFIKVRNEEGSPSCRGGRACRYLPPKVYKASPDLPWEAALQSPLDLGSEPKLSRGKRPKMSLNILCPKVMGLKIPAWIVLGRVRVYVENPNQK